MTSSDTCAAQHLFIGLGSGGADLLAALQRRWWLQGSGHDAATQPASLLIDSQTALQRPADAALWTVLGTDLQLPRARRVGLSLGALDAGSQVMERRQVHQAAQAQRQSVLAMVQAALPPPLPGSGGQTTVHLLCDLAEPVGSGLLPALLAWLPTLPDGPRLGLQVHARLPAAGALAGTQAAEARAAAALQELLAPVTPAAPADTALPPGQAGAAAFDVCHLSDAPDAAGRLCNWLHLLAAVPGLAAGAAAPTRAGRLIVVGQQALGLDLPERWSHLSHEMAQRMLYHLRHDHWRAHLGYVDHPAAAPAPALTQVGAEQLRRWGLHAEDLLMLPGFDPAAAVDAATTVAAQWREYEAHFRTLAAAAPAGQRLARLLQLFETALAGGWHGQGVEPYYTQLGDDLFRLADACAQRIEADLLLEWRDGRLSLHACGEFVAALMAALAPLGERAADQARALLERVAHLEAQRGELERGQANAATRGVLARIGGIGAISGIGRLGRTPGAEAAMRPDLAFDNALLLLRERAIALTLAAAQRFAAQYARALASRLSDLIGLIDAAELAIGTLAAEFEARALAGLPERHSQHPLDPRVRLDTLRQQLLSDEAHQRRHADGLRRTLFDLLGKRANFRTFALEVAEDHLCQPLLAQCAQAVQDLLRDPAPPPLWAGLAQRWQDEPAARAHSLQRLVAGARPPGLRREGVDGRSTHWSLVLPAPAQEPPADDFIADLAQALGDAGPASIQVVGITTPAPVPGTQAAAPPTLTLLGLHDLGVAAEGASRADWAARLQAALPQAPPPQGSRLVDLYTTSAPEALVPLIPPDPAELAQRTRTLLLLAGALGVVQASPDPVTAAPRLLLLRQDADGFELERSVIGHDLADAAAAPTAALVARLQRAVTEIDLDGRAHDPARHEALRDLLRQQVDALRTAAAATEQEPLTLAWSQAARAVMRFVRKEAPL